MRSSARFLALGLAAMVLSGCGSDAITAKKAGTRSAGDAATVGHDNGPAGEAKAAAPERGPLAAPKPGAPGGPATAEPSGDDKPSVPPADAGAMAGLDRSRARRDQVSQAGILTAGSFDDNLAPEFLRKFAGRFGQLPGMGDLPGRLLGQRLLLLVKNGSGQPVGNARVRVSGVGASTGVELVTRTDGRVVVLTSWDQLPTDADWTVTVTPPDGTAPVTETVPRGSPRWEITLPTTQAPLPKELDLALVIDTTGSMGDEMEYLKAEIRGIAAGIAQKFPEVKQRYGLVLYKDDGDQYVTRNFDFTPSLDAFRANLAAQSAGGGGDEPEAVHRALEDALQLRWREGNVARVLFLIGDAPPHAQHMNRAMTAADGLRKRGTSIYPVACSGYKDAAELVFRSMAVMTGSQFLFLTDDSGVGNPHAEPHIPFYHVEKLNDLMIRMIASELAGKRVDPDPSKIIRSVGKPIN